MVVFPNVLNLVQDVAVLIEFEIQVGCGQHDESNHIHIQNRVNEEEDDRFQLDFIGSDLDDAYNDQQGVDQTSDGTNEEVKNEGLMTVKELFAVTHCHLSHLKPTLD